MITPRDFVNRWAQSTLREQQAAQSHFNELCQLVGYKTPTQLDPEGKFFTFEEQVSKATGGKGRADVWYKGHFAWEYKGKHKDLDAAYAQLLAYKGGLDNPPLLVVCDFVEYRIYPQWPNISGLPFIFKNEDLLEKQARDFIIWLLDAPHKFLERRQDELQEREKLTLELAYKFAELADLMRDMKDDATKQPLWEPLQIARFLTKLVFALFAEDIDLMPRPFDQPVFRYLVDGAQSMPGTFVEEMQRLFASMDGVRPAFVMKPTPYFNGNLFSDSAPGAEDQYEVLDLTQVEGGIDLLGQVSEADWRFVNPTIFGNLFEGALDKDKRAQLGAHYTSEEDIRLVIDPVLVEPLYRQWDAVRASAEPLLQTFLTSDIPRDVTEAKTALLKLHTTMMDTLRNIQVLDPACGSGNFLYMSLRALKDLEGRVRRFFEPLDLPFQDVVTPRQLYGIEKDEFAAKLAHVVVWIGYLQWRYEDEGQLHFHNPRAGVPHPKELPNPIIQDKINPDEPDHILCADAIMRYDAEGKPYEPEWPPVDVIVGNPPFLGDKFMRTGRKELGQTGLGDAYVEDLRALYKERLPSCDLVCYWFEKARSQLELQRAARVGLLATNSIRGGSNRTVLDRIKETGSIFHAWGDRPWILSGAAVRISIVCFDPGAEQSYVLDGAPVHQINADLQNTIDATQARIMGTNKGLAFMGDTKGGAFDITPEIAQAMLATSTSNSSGRSNRDVIRPWANGADITGRSRGMWIIDFGTDMGEETARLYEAPFSYVQANVYPERQTNRRDAYRERWWLHMEARPGMRLALQPLRRFIVTPNLAKYRLFVWLDVDVIPDHQLIVFARDDDYFFGVLHSYPHEIWSLRLGTSLEDRPRYTPTTTFETFPFPWPPGQESVESPSHQAISTAAKALHEERELWLNPPELLNLGATADGKALKERTLTHLYNALQVYRAGQSNGEKIAKIARDFAPRLAQLHDALDQAVLSAYGWGDLADRLHSAEGDEELLRRLLALNLERAGAQS